ncbi:type I polyketide synthase [Streptomyces sp. Je 1-369]|uniref:type I polyketide synthase n=1 Tax=Streptomyces sp. Je 1-369 TaxID=2966192 RepID=UPI002285FE8F|nr:type I polyketide synthase [Streptomyces sp. Je 1-369]WAL99213.1 SDR family NAD(P)-dependent oxidoreductase [Streptomyces sp. Je 1-369]
MSSTGAPSTGTPSTEAKLRQYLKRVTVDLGQARQRLREVEERAQEPIAIVSMACRFPGDTRTPEALWDLVAAGGDAVGDFPTNRGWDLENLYHPDPEHPGTSYVRRGGFLHDAPGFDASFFGISPREALAMDPQQRVLMETAWQLLERAGIDPASLKLTPTGVYIGAGVLGFGGAQPDKAVEGHLLTGNALSVLSGRISFTLGLEGPSVSVDTACSSSLVSMHLAAQALRQGECDLAMAGGVTIMSTPGAFTEFSRQGALSPDGRSKAFAASADGTGFSEGAGLLLLERLSDARRNGHEVLAVIRGSAVNQDGASNGLTAPNGPSQERVIRAALANAGLGAAEVDAVEAHGTGTRLGDPIEAGALHATYGRERDDDHPLWLGSVKSNIGHPQGAAGVAGVIKMVMALRRELLPVTLYVDEPTPHVDWSSGTVRLLTEPVQWKRGERPRRAGVSAFGMSGTNAHVILEEAPEAPEAPDELAPRPAADVAAREQSAAAVVPWVVSARGEDALRAQAALLAAHVDDDRRQAPPTDVGWSLATTRSVFENRAVVVGTDHAALLDGLRSLADGEASPDVVSGAAGATGPGPVMVFPGQGGQWVGMGARLLDESPVFAARIAECEQALSAYVDWSLTDMLRGDGSELSRIDVVQPVLWAVMVALAAVWADQGIEPAAVVGHSQGEIAAACVVGAISLDEAARIVSVRSVLLRTLSGRGGMASLGMSQEQAAELIDGHPGVVVAAVNGPSSTVISGPPEGIEAVVADAQERGLRARAVASDVAGHGPQLDAILDELTDKLAGIRPAATDVAFYSTVTAAHLTDTTVLDTAYWVRNVRRTVRFADTIDALLADGYRLFIEASPHPVLNLALESIVERADVSASVIPTLRRDHGDTAQLARAAAQAFTAGADVDWRRWFPADPAPRTVDLPTYAFQRQDFWITPTAGRSGDPAGLGLAASGHPLLGASVGLASGDVHLLSGRVSRQSAAWLDDHVVAGHALVPGAAQVEWVLRAADEAGCPALEELTLQTPLVLPDAGGLRIQVVVDAADTDGRRDVRLFSRLDDTDSDDAFASDRPWTCHATGALGPERPSERPSEEVLGDAEPEPLDGAWPPSGAEPVSPDDLYAQADRTGYGYGPAFRGVRALWRHGRDVLAEVTLPEEAGDPDGFGIHPALLDAVLQPAALLLPPTESAQVWLPFAWNDVVLHAVRATAVRVRLTLLGERVDQGLRIDVADAVGAPVLTVRDLRSRPTDTERLAAAGVRERHGLFDLKWLAPDHAGGHEVYGTLDSAPDSWVTLGEDVADLTALLTSIESGAPTPPLVAASVAPAPADDGLALATHVLDLVQAWLAVPLHDSRLVLVTRGAVAYDGNGNGNGGGCGDGDVDVAAAAVWGLVRSAQSENPDRFTLIDLGPDDTLADAMDAVRLDEPQLAFHHGEIRVPRLIRAAQDGRAGEGVSEKQTQLDPDGTVLITGGSGVLGRLVAEHLVREWGVRHLLLASRRGDRTPNSDELRMLLTELGATTVDIAAADVADAEAVAALIASVDPARPLTGVIHAAGVLDDAVVTAQTHESLARVWAAKATAARLLHEATREIPLGLFAVFSSAAASLGSPGQANYAAANAYCDALMQHRRAHELAGLSIAWGLWRATSGMTGQLSDTDLARMKRTGFAALTDEGGLALLDAARAHDHAYVVAADLDPRAVTDGLSPLLRTLTAPATRRRVASEGLADGALAARLVGLDEDGRLELLTGVVREYVAAVLGHGSASRVSVDTAFKDLGFDSLTAVELRNRLSAACDVRLPATLIFDHPTPQALATHLVHRLAGTSVPAPTPAAPRRRPATTDSADIDDPVAIVAMTCRFPGGVSSADDLWDLLDSRTDAMGGFPTDRGWDLGRLFHPDPEHTGTTYADQGGFLPDAGDFDAAFFGINPREALAMDPQQRLLLEASWEVFERAGIDPTTLKGSLTGTYVGLMNHDYAKSFPEADAQLEGYAYLASTGSMVSGRVAYTFGLEGPAVTVDTACSSSLVSIHLAAQALRQGECDLALAGGVTVMADPDMFAGFARQRGLSPDGRCKPYAAAADGVGFSEGVGVLLLERLSDARRNGHRVLSVVRGSAVNQDGASNGLTAPNGPSQERVIRQALASGRLVAADVDVVEGHGTGTTLGDPIEAQALLATYGQGRSVGRPVWLGSVKSNIGHTQAAAGVAGVIKMVMAMRHGVVPASLHVDEPTPHVDWGSGAVRLAGEAVPWPDADRGVRRAGVSSFGASGTNAHVIVEHVPEPAGEPVVAADDDGALVPWVVSARSPRALRGQARRLSTFAEDVSRAPLTEVGWSLLGTRALHERRAVVLAADRAELVAGLDALAAGEPHPALIVPSSSQLPVGDDVVWLFSGQGSQVVGMGAGLYERFPVFAEAFDEVCGLLDVELGGSVREVVFEGPRERLDHTVWAQAGLFALQVGLARLWVSVGVRPDVVVGHSVGEIAAAHVAGVFSLADACRVVGARARLMGALPEGGAMCAVQATREELAADVDGSGVSVAAVNTPDSTVISGPVVEVERVVALWREKGRKTKALSVSHAFHSVLMEPMLADFTEAIRGVEFAEPTIPLISNVTGEEAGAEITASGYWARHVRQAVLFQPAIAQVADRAGVFVELGPAPVLATAAQRTLDDVADTRGGFEPVVTASLHAGLPDDVAFAQAMARLHAGGVDVDWSVFFPAGPAPRTVELPTYAFQRERFWLAGRAGSGDAAGLGLVAAGHPLLGAAVEFADRGGCLLTGRLSRSGVSWLADHEVGGAVLVPGAALVEWALRAGDEVGCATLDELMLQAPVVVPETAGLRVQVVVDEAGEDGRRGIHVYSRPDVDASTVLDGDDSWVCHATGLLAPESPLAVGEMAGAWPPVDAEPLGVEGFYATAAADGYGYGPAFQGLQAVWRHGQDLLAEVALPEAAGTHDGYGIHPALLDAALHPLLVSRLQENSGDDQLYVPFAWTGVSLRAVGATTVRVRLRPAGESAEHGVSVTVTDATGGLVLSADALQTRPVQRGQLVAAQQRDVRGLFAVEWTPLMLPSSLEGAGVGSEWVALSGEGGGLAGVVSVVGDVAPWAVLAPVDASGGDGLRVAEGVLSLVQEFLAASELEESRLLVVTRSAVDTSGDGDVDASAAAVWGLVRSAQSENPGRFVLLDIDGDLRADDPDVVLPQSLLRQAVEDLGEPQLALCDGVLHIPRLTRARRSSGIVAPPGEAAWRLRMVNDGSLDDLAAVACPEVLEPLASGQVRLSVHAAGINFRDVLVALGMVPAYGAMGGEGAGVVTEVGPGVTHLSVGDRVMGVFEGAYGPVAIADARMVAPVPRGWDMREVAGMPAAFLTAWYGLVELAGLKAGERVLIHAATGGVGMAAVQIARHLGAEVFATASPAKHGVLEEMGIDAAHRASSRDLAFEDVFHQATDGRGVDVVLNSLAGEFIDASLRLLGEDGGRFLEMGKTDVRAAEEVGAEYPGVTYTVYDLVGDAGPERVGRMLDQLGELFASDRLKALPVRSWPLGKAQEAFRFMSQAKHTGKLVLEIPPALDPEGTVLITGGTGALGQVVAEHLVREWGVRHLLLASRRGPGAPGSTELVARLAELGATADIVVADVSDPVSVAELVGKTDPSHPLTGVVHAAGVLEDAVVTAQTRGGLGRVWAAKATAAANLHEATHDLRLGLFVVFSSAAATLGSPGQANYAAANAYCDALMQHRRAHGQAGLSVGWGLWESTHEKTGNATDGTTGAGAGGKTGGVTDGMTGGMTGGLTSTDIARMSRIGVNGMTDAHGLALLDAAYRNGRPHLVGFNLDLRTLATHPVETRPALLRGLAAPTTGGANRPTATAGGQPADLAGRLAALPPTDRHHTLVRLIREQAATVLGHHPDSFTPGSTFKELGFDSLTAVELRNRLSAATGLRLPSGLVFDHPDADVLAEHLGAQLAPDGDTPTGGQEATDPLLRDLAKLEHALSSAHVEHLDADAVTSRLESLLSKWKSASAVPGSGSTKEQLKVATTDQVLDFIDKELGV